MFGMGKSHEVPAKEVDPAERKVPVVDRNTNTVEFVPAKDLRTGKFGEEQKEAA